MDRRAGRALNHSYACSRTQTRNWIEWPPLPCTLRGDRLGLWKGGGKGGGGGEGGEGGMKRKLGGWW